MPSQSSSAYSSAEDLRLGTSHPQSCQVPHVHASTRSQKARKDYIYGLCLLVVVVVTWVGSSAAIQGIFGSGNFNKPFFLTWFSTSCYMVHLPFHWQKLRDQVWLRLPPKDKRMGVRQVARFALAFCPLWLGMEYTFNLSLDYTSVASNTVLSSICAPFTLILSWLFLKHTITWPKFLGVVMTVGGVCAIVFSDDSSSGSSTVGGDVLALSSALLYAVYVVGLAQFIKSDAQIDMSLLFGLLGVVNFVFGWPILLVLNWTGAEIITNPSGTIWLVLIANSLIGTVLSDWCWARSILLTSEIVGTVGLSLTIPLGFVWDAAIKGKHFTVWYFVGAALVFIGFFAVHAERKKQLDVQAADSDSESDSSSEHTILLDSD